MTKILLKAPLNCKPTESTFSETVTRHIDVGLILHDCFVCWQQLRVCTFEFRQVNYPVVCWFLKNAESFDDASIVIVLALSSAWNVTT